MLESIVDIHLVVVDSERPIQYASLLQLGTEVCRLLAPTSTLLLSNSIRESWKTYVFFDGMSTKLAAENLQDLFAHPSAFGEGCEGEVVWVDFA